MFGLALALNMIPNDARGDIPFSMSTATVKRYTPEGKLKARFPPRGVQVTNPALPVLISICTFATLTYSISSRARVMPSRVSLSRHSSG